MGYHALPPYGCADSANFVPLITLASVTIFMQAVLATMFIYPLVKHRKQTDYLLRNSENGKVMTLIKRTAFSAGFSVLINCCFFPASTGQYGIDDVPMLLCDINLAVIVLSAVLAFVDWKSRLFPCIIHPNTDTL